MTDLAKPGLFCVMGCIALSGDDDVVHFMEGMIFPAYLTSQVYWIVSFSTMAFPDTFDVILRLSSATQKNQVYHNIFREHFRGHHIYLNFSGCNKTSF